MFLSASPYAIPRRRTALDAAIRRAALETQRGKWGKCNKSVWLDVSLNLMSSIPLARSFSLLRIFWRVGFTFEAMYVMCFNEDAGMMRTGTPHPVLTYMELSNQSLPMSAALPILRKFGHRVPIASISEPFKASFKWKEVTLALRENVLFSNKPCLSVYPW